MERYTQGNLANRVTLGDVRNRIRRLKELASGVDIELVALALGCEPLTAEEHRVYRAGLEQMAHARGPRWLLVA